jgi:uncharacterized protein (TIGR02145 family)
MKKKTISIAVLIVLFLTFLMQNSCKKEEETNPNPEESGLVLTKYLIETELPCFVNIMFQVSDLNGKGVDNLSTSDFEVQEDSQPVSPTESAMIINKKESLDYEMKTVLMIDNSLSVGNNIDEIKNAAIALVNNIVDKQEIAIYVFSETPVLLKNFTSNVNALTTAINSITLGYATTNLYGSISEGVSRWEDYYSTSDIKQGFMILITDGSDTQGTSTLNQALNDIGNKKVYTVGIGSEQDQVALEQLGSAGYFSLSDYSELTNNFTEIQNEIIAYSNSFYWLYYMSPKRENNSHLLKLSVKGNSNTSSNAYIIGEFNSSGFYSVQQGVVINGGMNSVTLDPAESVIFGATTYYPENPPNYSWESSDASVISVLVFPENNALAQVNAIGSEGQSAIITVTDLSNSLSNYISVIISEDSPTQFTDNRDGKTYQIVHLNNQTWFAENLNYIVENDSWAYNNDPANASIYGLIYNFEGASYACPDGWHLPSDSEWDELITFLGGTDVAGGKMKESGTIHWASPNTGASNSSGFSSLPGGFRTSAGVFSSMSFYAEYWSSTIANDTIALGRTLYHDNTEANRRGYKKFSGSSVRCIKDN